jgi:hypothetical protein
VYTDPCHGPWVEAVRSAGIWVAVVFSLATLAVVRWREWCVAAGGSDRGE